MSMMDAKQEISLTLPGMGADQVYAESARGREALSEAYSFEVDVISSRMLGLAEMLGKAAKLEIRVVDETAVVHGIIETAETLDPTPNREFCYRFRIVPALALLKLSRQNQVYGTDRDVTIVDIVENELSDANKSGSSTAGNRSARHIAHRMHADKANYPKQDFVMQYRESDFDFISRLCEKFGIFYAFDHGGDREHVLLCDRNAHFRELSGKNIKLDLPFRSASQILSDGGFAVRSFNARHRVRPGTVQLREYNDDTPSVDLSVSADTAFAGHGVDVLYGEHYATAADGRFLARIRAEQLAAGQLEFTGESNIPLVRPGLFFRLVDHPATDFEQLYVVTQVEHDISEPTPLGFSSPDGKAVPYRNRFVCIPFKTAYRPARRTEKPVVHGVLIAFVDGEKDAGKPQLDEFGRYRIRFVDEESGLSGGTASHFVRKAEPYGGGDGYGSHSTLLVGTEILLGFLHGDPDRPVILGALSNAEKMNPVIDNNNTVAHRTRTASGIVFQIRDAAV